MSSEWQVVALGDVAEIVGGTTPSTKEERFWGGEVAWITPRDLSGYKHRYISRGERNLSDEGRKVVGRVLPSGAVLVSSRAPIGYVAIAGSELATNQGFRSLILRDSHVPEFFYYLLKVSTARLETAASGSTFREITGGNLKQLEFGIPNPDEQRRIAGVLGALDDKIEHNDRAKDRLGTLLAMLYRAHFRARDHDVTLLGNEVEIVMGQSPPGSTYTTNGDLGVPLVQGMAAFCDRFPDTEVFTSAPTKLARPGDVLMTVRAPVGEINIADREYCIGRGVAAIRSHAPAYAEQLMRSLTDRWTTHEAGTIFPAVNRSQIASLEIDRHPETEIERFEHDARPVYDLMAAMSRERRRLVAIRDALLPKLVSGKIRVPESYDPDDVVGTVVEEATGVTL